jgi:hypothetical protein
MNSPATKDHNFFVFLGNKDENGQKASSKKYSKGGSKSKKRNLNNIINQRDRILNKKYVKLANLISKNPGQSSGVKKPLYIQENP